MGLHCCVPQHLLSSASRLLCLALEFVVSNLWSGTHPSLPGVPPLASWLFLNLLDFSLHWTAKVARNQMPTRTLPFPPTGFRGREDSKLVPNICLETAEFGATRPGPAPLAGLASDGAQAFPMSFEASVGLFRKRPVPPSQDCHKDGMTLWALEKF